MLVENRFTSQTRRVFLFENLVIVAKKSTKDGKEFYTFKESYRVIISRHGNVLNSFYNRQTR